MSEFNKGLLNAKTLGDLFTIDNVVAGTITIAAATTVGTAAHGLSATPTFLIATGQGSTAADRAITIAADATNVSAYHVDTDGATQTVSYIAAVLA